MSKAIMIRPATDLSDRIAKQATHLRTSKAALCSSALEFALPLIEAGEMALVNGKLQFTAKAKGTDKKQAA